MDQLFHDGRVVDSMNIGIGSLSTGIFNVAELCIITGVVLLVVEAVWFRQMPMIAPTRIADLL